MKKSKVTTKNIVAAFACSALLGVAVVENNQNNAMGTQMVSAQEIPTIEGIISQNQTKVDEAQKTLREKQAAQQQTQSVLDSTTQSIENFDYETAETNNDVAKAELAYAQQAYNNATKSLEYVQKLNQNKLTDDEKRQRLGDQNSEQETLEQLAQEVKDAKSKELNVQKSIAGNQNDAALKQAEASLNKAKAAQQQTQSVLDSTTQSIENFDYETAETNNDVAKAELAYAQQAYNNAQDSNNYLKVLNDYNSIPDGQEKNDKAKELSELTEKNEDNQQMLEQLAQKVKDAKSTQLDTQKQIAEGLNEVELDKAEAELADKELSRDDALDLMNKLNAENEDIQKDNSKSVSEKAESKFKLEAAQADYKVKDAEFKYAQQLQANASQALDYAKKLSNNELNPKQMREARENHERGQDKLSDSKNAVISANQDKESVTQNIKTARENLKKDLAKNNVESIPTTSYVPQVPLNRVIDKISYFNDSGVLLWKLDQGTLTSASSFLYNNSTVTLTGKTKVVDGIKYVNLEENNGQYWVQEQYLQSSQQKSEKTVTGTLEAGNVDYLIYLRDESGNMTSQTIEPHTSWRVFAQKTQHGHTYYRVGTSKQWIEDTYVKSLNI